MAFLQNLFCHRRARVGTRTPAAVPAQTAAAPVRTVREVQLGSLARLPDALLMDHVLPAALQLSERQQVGMGADTLRNFAATSPMAATLALGAAAHIQASWLQLHLAVAAAGLTQDPRGPDPRLFARQQASIHAASAARTFTDALVQQHPLQMIRNAYVGAALARLFAPAASDPNDPLFRPALRQLRRTYPNAMDAVNEQVQKFIDGLEEQSQTTYGSLHTKRYGCGTELFKQVQVLVVDAAEKDFARARSMLLGRPLSLPQAQWPAYHDRATAAKHLLTEQLLPDNALMMAQLARAKGDWRATILFASNAVRRWPEGGEGHFLLGLARSETDDLVAADAAFSKVLLLEPCRLDALAERALVRHLQGRHRDVVTDLQDVVHTRSLLHSLSPERTTLARRVLASSYYALGHETLAEQHFIMASMLAPNNSETLVHLGILYWRQKRYKNSFFALRTALRHNDDFGEAHALFGEWMLQFGQNKKAAAHLRRAVDLGVFSVRPLAAEAERRMRHTEAAG